MPDQLPLDFGATRRARPAGARSDNAAAAISPAEKADQSEIQAPSTSPAGQPEIHGAEEHQLQVGEQDSICDTSSELAHRSHVGTSSESESGLGFDDIGKLLGSGPLNLSASVKDEIDRGAVRSKCVLCFPQGSDEPTQPIIPSWLA